MKTERLTRQQVEAMAWTAKTPEVLALASEVLRLRGLISSVLEASDESLWAEYRAIQGEGDL